jgi:hypothetical protein
MEADKGIIRNFVAEMLTDEVDNFDEVDIRWRKTLGVS